MDKTVDEQEFERFKKGVIADLENINSFGELLKADPQKTYLYGLTKLTSLSTLMQGRMQTSEFEIRQEAQPIIDEIFDKSQPKKEDELEVLENRLKVCEVRLSLCNDDVQRKISQWEDTLNNPNRRQIDITRAFGGWMLAAEKKYDAEIEYRHAKDDVEIYFEENPDAAKAREQEVKDAANSHYSREGFYQAKRASSQNNNTENA